MMKRRDDYNHMDRNHTAANSNYPKPQRTNIVSPEFLLGHLWMQEQETNGVKIIELDSNSSNNDVNDDEEKQTLSHAWSYINQERFRISQSPEQEYKVNHKARDKHRQKTRYKLEVSSPEDDVADEDCIDYFYSNHENQKDSVNRNFVLNRKTDCYTNTDPYPNTSDSSADVEYIDRKDMKHESAWNASDAYYDEILTYDSNIEAEKRTIYIYSFKNKHLLTDNDGGNFSNGSGSTDTSVDEEKDDNSNVRVPSPIPNIYVPKLNLLQPPKLPTVAEITEPKSSEESFKSMKDVKMSNGWFQNTRAMEDREYKYRSDNLISWMALSPREKRRRTRNTFCDNCRHQMRFPMVRKASPIPEEDLYLTKNNNESSLPTLRKIKIDDNNSVIDKIECINDVCEDNLDDRGDHVQIKSLRKPKIQISPYISPKKPVKITDPIEKLDNNNWIGEEIVVNSSHKNNAEVVEDQSIVEGELSRRLWEKNAVFLKPSEWSAFYPIDSSVPSLHLSLETDYEEVPWFRRIMRCLKCFK